MNEAAWCDVSGGGDNDDQTAADAIFSVRQCVRRWGRRDTLVRRLEWGGVSVTVKSSVGGGEE